MNNKYSVHNKVSQYLIYNYHLYVYFTQSGAGLGTTLGVHINLRQSNDIHLICTSKVGLVEPRIH